MSQLTDVIVVGGGVIGLAIARALNERGVGRVTVIERAEPGAEASYAAGGMLAAQAEANQHDELFELSVSSRDLYPALAASLLDETGIDVQLERTGTLYLAFTESDEADLERRFQWQTKASLPVERLSKTETLELEPDISPRVRGALRFPLDVQVDNRLLIAALVSSLAMRGVEILTGTQVTSLHIQNDRIAGVETDSGTIRGSVVVLAAGAWTSFLINSDSLLPPVRIEPVRGQMLCFEPLAPPRHVLYSHRGYIIPRHNGRILAGSTSERAGFCKDVTGEGIHTIMTNALEIAPEIVRSAPLVDSWAGLRPRAEDGLPIIGACRGVEGLYYATGHYRNGILLAPITGELIADQIMTGTEPAMLDAFSPARFQPVTIG
jgi:glycine oxidase